MNGYKERIIRKYFEKACNWLKYMDLLLENLSQLSPAQVEKLAAKIRHLCC